MAEFKTGRPSQEIRLRAWDGGRVNLLRLAVQNLESELNSSLGSAVVQTARRKVSDQIPFVLDFEVRPGFRQVQCVFSAPPGLGGHPFRQLLFYELQHDATPAFSDPTTIQTTQTTIAIAGFALGEERSFRIRVVNTFGNASVWTRTLTVTVAQSKIQQTSIADVDMRLEGPIGYWRTVSDSVYTPVDANACVNAHIALSALHFDVDRKREAVTRKTLRGGPASVQFRWRIGSFNSITQDFDLQEFGPRTLLSARPGFALTSGDLADTKNPLAFGTFITPFYVKTAGTPVRIQLQAAKTPGSEWRGSQRERDLIISDPVVFVRNAQIIEVLRDI